MISDVVTAEGELKSLPEVHLAVYDRVLTQLKNHANQFKMQRLIVFAEEPPLIEAMVGHKMELSSLKDGVMGMYEL